MIFACFDGYNVSGFMIDWYCHTVIFRYNIPEEKLISN